LPGDLLPLSIPSLIDGQDENIDIERSGLNSGVRHSHSVFAIDDRAISQRANMQIPGAPTLALAWPLISLTAKNKLADSLISRAEEMRRFMCKTPALTYPPLSHQGLADDPRGDVDSKRAVRPAGLARVAGKAAPEALGQRARTMPGEASGTD
jgi:hypothetical protein